MSKITPLFILSLPRSGSTLLQKMLMVSPEIHSVSEPWLLLPISFMLKEEGTLAIYDHKKTCQAIEDFINILPNKLDDFYHSLEDFILSLYMKTAHQTRCRYFIDKTPRYYLILPFLHKVFPDARFIFLFRNPLEVLASILTTWTDNRFILYYNYIDLFYGPKALSEGYAMFQECSMAVLFKDLVLFPEDQMKKICAFLAIDFDPSMISNFNEIRLQGRAGDSTGINLYQGISQSPLDKWKSVMNTHYRKWFSKRYAQYLGDTILRDFNTSVEEMIHDIDAITPLRGGSLQDAFYHLVFEAARFMNIRYDKKIINRLKNNEKFYTYL